MTHVVYFVEQDKRNCVHKILVAFQSYLPICLRCSKTSYVIVLTSGRPFS